MPRLPFVIPVLTGLADVLWAVYLIAVEPDLLNENLWQGALQLVPGGPSHSVKVIAVALAVAGTLVLVNVVRSRVSPWGMLTGSAVWGMLAASFAYGAIVGTGGLGWGSVINSSLMVALHLTVVFIPTTR